MPTPETPDAPLETFAASRERSAKLERELLKNPAAFRILTGDRPTGLLHLGHYFGTLQNRVRLQNLGTELFVIIADYQALTDRDAPSSLPIDVDGLIADYLATGIDPDKATIFAHSCIPPLNQLMLPFLSLVSVAEIGRNPTVKDEISASGRNFTTGLMYTYPVHQAADILSVRGTVVPAGKDQLPHLELTRIIARRFNERYSPIDPVFEEPTVLLSETPLLLGLDGQKMSKSRNNAIALAATADETAQLIKRAKTDSDRHITYDPVERKEVANLLLIAALCQSRQPEEIAAEIGDAGAAALKTVVTDSVNTFLAPIRQRRTEIASDQGYLRSVLQKGNARALEEATLTLDRVCEAMHTAYPLPS